MPARPDDSAMHDPTQPPDGGSLKEIGSILGIAIALLAIVPRVWKWMSAVARYVRDFGRMPTSVREIRDMGIGYERVLDLQLSVQGIACFHCDSKGILLRTNRDFDRLAEAGIGESVSRPWRDIFNESEREQILRGWKEAVVELREFVHEGYLQLAPGKGPPQRVKLRCVYLPQSFAGAGTWCGIVRELP